MFPVHGAATAFYQQKFWVLGGATGDDSYDESITDKVFFYHFIISFKKYSNFSYYYYFSILSFKGPSL